MYTVGKILVPVDFSACSRAALDYAAFLAARFGASIDVLHIWSPPRAAWGPPYPISVDHDRLVLFERTEAGRKMKEFLAHLEEEGGLQVRGRIESGDAYATILNVAAGDDYDLIVMGTHGRTGMTHLLLGSIAESVVRRAPCPVATIRASSAPRPWRSAQRGARCDA
jgi:universal stress protein A